jgi:hypothetical protein
MQDFVSKRGADAKAEGRERILPNARRTIESMRQIGYSLEQAIADLVDNSINAKASTVLIRFITKGDRVRSVVIGDDGIGMNRTQLKEAMKFGTERSNDPKSLGKYGMGLKLASLSHAKCLTVVTKQAAAISAMRWTIEGIQKGWECEELARPDSVMIMDAPWSPLKLRQRGTLVIWDDLDKLPTSGGDLRGAIRKFDRRLKVHLGLCFHRFIEDDRLTIVLDSQTDGEREHSIRQTVPALNPFKYRKSGDPGYPKTFRVNMPDMGTLRAEAHIWPPNDNSEEYKLGGRTASRQGFYFYRNDRLIQAGGWNGLVETESEPHGSLARVLIDLPTAFDSFFGLNVQKSAVVAPPNFEAVVRTSTADDDTSFDQYRKRAQLVYRQKDTRATKDRPVIVSSGMPSRLTSLIHEVVADGKSVVRRIHMKWAVLDSANVFTIDRAKNTIYLNRQYRKTLLMGRRASSADLPTFKTLIFLLLRDEFYSERVSSQKQEWLDSINEFLIRAIQSEE